MNEPQSWRQHETSPPYIGLETSLLYAEQKWPTRGRLGCPYREATASEADVKTDEFRPPPNLQDAQA